MSRRPTARSRGGGGRDDGVIEAFLLHLAAEGVISSAQLQRAQEALRIWTPATAGKQQRSDTAAAAESSRPVQHGSGLEEQLQQERRHPHVPVRRISQREHILSQSLPSGR